MTASEKASKLEFRIRRIKKGIEESTDSVQYVEGVNERSDNREQVPTVWEDVGD